MLETQTVLAIKQAGGQITRDQGLIQAVFDENSFGFWLDMLLFIEIIKQITEDTAEDLYGYTLLLGKDSLAKPESLCRIMAGGPEGGGVFMDQSVAQAMQPYITVASREKWEPESATLECGIYMRLKEIKIIIPAAANSLALTKAAAFPNSLEQNSSVLYTGLALKGKRAEIYLQTSSPGNDRKEIPPIFVRFGSGGLCTLIDAYAQWMRTVPDWIPLGQPAVKYKEMTSAWEFLFRERLRKNPSPYAVRKAREFFGLLLDFYCDIAENAGKPPVVVLENIHIAENEASEIVIKALSARQNIRLLGLCPVEIQGLSLVQWKPLFSRVINVSNGAEAAGPQYSGLPFDLWELGYICCLFGTYFPPEYIPLLLEESGKSPAMISRAISLMQTLKVIDTSLDPRPWNEQFMEQAESVLGKKKDTLRALASGRLLAWVEYKKINPCVSLLRILVKLGAADKIDDSLILKSIHNELSVTNGQDLEKAVEKRIFKVIAGKERELVIRHIAQTLLAMHSGSAEMIRDAFAVQTPECSAFPLLQTQVLINQALYNLGLRNNDQAMEAAKQAAIICQKNNSPCLAMSYRLMALASLSHKRINETINYLGFALENAAVSGEPMELGMAGYYAACVQLLYGNLSLSAKYAEKARACFLEAGSPCWADRSRFLEGRLFFEAGYYTKALDVFEELLKNPNGENGSEKQNLTEAWASRARSNNEGPNGVTRNFNLKLAGLDAGIFQLEALYLAGEYAKMEELAERLSVIPVEDDFIHAEQPDWRSGFAQCELLFFSRKDLWEKMLGAWRSLAQCRLSPQKAAEAQTAMQQTLKKSSFPEIDTCDPFYYFALYKTLEHSGASQVDIRTAASAAFNRLQNRAAKIDDSEIRQKYLKLPHWSKALSQAAIEFKLV
jgi:tetratricopeptide (TPR) repeat protein